MAGDKTYITDGQGKLHRATRVHAVTPTDIVWSSNPNDYTVQVKIGGKWHRAVLTMDAGAAQFFDNVNIDKGLVVGTDGKTHTALIVKPESTVTLSDIKTDTHGTIAGTTTGETAVSTYSENWSDVKWQDNVNVYKVLVTGSDGKVHTALLTTSAGGGGVQVIVLGPSPLSLPDAVAHSLSYVKAFGGTEQRNLPDGYQQLEYIESTGTQYIDTGISSANVTQCKVNTKFKFGTISSSRYVLGTLDRDAAVTKDSAFGCLISYTDGKNWCNNYAFTASATQMDRIEITTDTEYEYELAYANQVSSCKLNDTVRSYNNDSATKSLNGSMYIFAGNDTGSVGKFIGKIYYFRMELNNSLVANMVPCRRNSDNELGMYDTVSGQFFTNAGTGDFVAGPTAVPTPTAPIDIVCNNGVLRVRHQSGLPLGYQKVESLTFTSGAYIITDIYPNQDTEFIVDVKKNADNLVWLFGARDYPSTTSSSVNKFSLQGISSSSNTLWFQFDNTTNIEYNSVAVTSTQTERLARHTFGIKNKRIYMDGEAVEFGSYGVPDWSNFTTLNPLIIGGNYQQSGGILGSFSGDLYGATGLILCKRLSDNVSGLYNPTTGNFFPADGTGTITAGDPVNDPVEIYTDGTVETIEDTIGNSATCEPLLAVGDYVDVQSIIDGVVTRNVGVKVLDGTEDWQLATATNLVQFYTSSTQGVIANNVSLTSTIAPYGCTVATRTQYDFGCYSGGSGNLCFQMKGSATLTTVSAWTQYLADQYAAGTPVIVIYPMVTPTTESVAGQTLQVQDGDNTLEITQASLAGLELEAEYTKVA